MISSPYPSSPVAGVRTASLHTSVATHAGRSRARQEVPRHPHASDEILVWLGRTALARTIPENRYLRRPAEGAAANGASQMNGRIRNAFESGGTARRTDGATGDLHPVPC